MTPTPKVFCIGWAKTGTTSLGRAFRVLGYRNLSKQMDLFAPLEEGNLQPIFDMVDQYDSFDDWPWILLYKELAERYPDAKFILSLRDERKMLQSYRKMVAQELRRHERTRDIRKFIYGVDMEQGSDQTFINRVRQHNADVRTYFADKPDRLLEIDVTTGAGWAPICAFLDKPIPDIPFPHSNAAKSRSPVKTALRNIVVRMRAAYFRLVDPQ